MKFCDICQLCMKRNLQNGNIVYECSCGNKVVAQNDELCIFSEVYIDTSDSIEKYTTYINNSIYDDTVNLIKKTCPKCGSEYMKHLHISESMISVHTHC